MMKKIILALLVLVPVGIVSAKDMAEHKKKGKQYSAEQIKNRQAKKDAKRALKDAKKKAAAATDKTHVKKKRNKRERKKFYEETSDNLTQAAVEATLAQEQAMEEMAKAKTPEELKEAHDVAQEAAKTSEELGDAERVVGDAEDSTNEVVAESADDKKIEAQVGALLEELARTITEPNSITEPN